MADGWETGKTGCPEVREGGFNMAFQTGRPGDFHGEGGGGGG